MLTSTHQVLTPYTITDNEKSRGNPTMAGKKHNMPTAQND